MTLEQIKTAVERGETVHWATTAYEVVKDSIGQWLIIYHRGRRDEHCIGLTHQDGVTMNGARDQFFIRGTHCRTCGHKL